MDGCEEEMDTSNPKVDEKNCKKEASDIKSLSQPVCLIVLGMAGSGKTTLINKLTAHLYAQGKSPYVLNLDPACREVPYPANIGQ